MYIRGMIILRRLFLLSLLPVIPAAVTWLLYQATLYALERLYRSVNPDTLAYITGAEFVAVLLICLLEVRDRW